MGHGDSYGSQCSCGVGTGSGGVHCKGVAGRAPLRDRACATTPAGRQGQDKGKENYEYGSRPGRPFSSCACKHPHRPDREQGRQCQRTHFHFARRMRRSRKCGCHRYVRRLGIGGTSQLSCSFSPTMLQPTANNSQTTNITVTAALTASTHPSREMKVRSLALTALFPIWAVWVFAGARREWTPRTRTVLIILFPFVLALSSCGSGGTSAVPQGGSTSYTLTVNASAAGTNTTRTLGTVTVTVTH